jgi:hypothetical protein
MVLVLLLCLVSSVILHLILSRLRNSELPDVALKLIALAMGIYGGGRGIGLSGQQFYLKLQNTAHLYFADINFLICNLA